MFDTSERSPMLVFAVGGRLGSGCSFVRDWLRHSLSTFGYEVEILDVTGVFLEQIGAYLPDTNEKTSEVQDLTEHARRIRQLQENGNRLRQQLGSEIIAALCVSEIIHPHIIEHRILDERKRQAYIIDSLKHPDEVRFLRKVFRDAFCMVGVVASDRVRMKRLHERKQFDDTSFKALDEIDADERGTTHGQKAIDAVTVSDYFFANDYATKAEIQSEADRLMRLIFGVEVQSPRPDEVGMQAAYKAARRSACLSRQVGAAIFDSEGHVLSIGHNDVPQFGGGLYGPESRQDERCYARGGKCYNDEEKQLIVEELAGALKAAGLVDANVSELSLQAAIKKSRIKNLIEFSRAVHAEMSAIIAVARSSRPGLSGATLYCTTFPCHNCAKHIIAAGISRVLYLEPYEKSLARRLHADAINAPDEERQLNKVAFDLYGGASPSQFENYFGSNLPRKDDGKFVDRDRSRTGLLPLGAQEHDILWSRLNYVTDQINAAVQRVRPSVPA